MAHIRSLLLIFLCFALLFGFFIKKPSKEDAVYLVYTALFTVDEEISDSFSLGERLTDARGKESAGEILKITREKALGEDAYGIYEIPKRVTLAITLGGFGVKKNGEGKIGTLTPKVGEAVYLLGRARIEGVCVRARAI